MEFNDERIAEIREKHSEAREYPVCDDCLKTTKGKHIYRIGDSVICEDCIDNHQEYMEEEY